MSRQGSIKYQTAAQFEEAVWVAFHSAQEEAPDDPHLIDIRSKWDDAASAQEAYEAQKASAEQESGHPPAEEQAPAPAEFGQSSKPAGLMAMLKQRALKKEQDADTALRKWYSNLWRERQTLRR
jgi:hypothetical protein